MSDNPSPSVARPGQERYVAQTDEQGLGAVDAVADESAPASMWGEAWKQLRRRPIFWVSALLIAAVVALSLVPGLFVSADPTFCELKHSFGDPAPGHPFGFNRQGCDIYARTVYGARASVTVGVLTTLLVLVLGVVIGALAANFFTAVSFPHIFHSRPLRKRRRRRCTNAGSTSVYYYRARR